MKHVWISAFALALCVAPLAEAQDLGQIKAELVAKMANLRDREIQLNNASRALQAKERRLEQQMPQLQSRTTQLNEELTKREAEFSRYNQAVAQHNSGCAGTFQDQGHVNRCNQRASDLDAWKAAAQARANQFEAQRVAHLNNIERFRREATKLENDQKANTAALQKTRAGISTIQTALDKLALNDGFLKDPRARQQISSTCAKIVNLEQSVECMKRVFDGAQAR